MLDNLVRINENDIELFSGFSKKGYTYIGVSIIVLLTLGLTASAFFLFDTNESSISYDWKETSPVESKVSYSGNEGNIQQHNIIDEYEENENSGWKKTDTGKVLWENDLAYIEIDPHTCNSFHCKHNWKIINKDGSDQTINVGFILSDSQKNPSIYRLETVTKERPVYNEVKYSEWNEENQTWNNYTTLEENGIEEYQKEEYINRNSAFSSSNINGNKAYYTTGYSISADSTQQGYFEYDNIPIKTPSGYKTNGKWEMVLWKGDYNNPTWELKLDPWFNFDYGFRFNVTVNSSEVDSDLTNFPVFFNLSDAPSEFWSNIQSDGDDILVTEGEDTELFCELNSLNIDNENGELYFNANISSSTDTVFYIYYGNSGETSPQCDDTETWQSDYLGVWHLGEDATGSSPQFLDATSNNRDGTAVDYSLKSTQLSAQGNETVFNGTHNHITIPAFSFTGDPFTVTIVYYINESTVTGEHQLFGNEQGGNGGITITQRSGNLEYWHQGITNWVTINQSTGQTRHIIQLRRNSSSGIDAYLDGTKVLTGGGSGLGSPSEILRFGEFGAGGRNLNGTIDEIRLHTDDLSDSLLESEYSNLANTDLFYNVGEEEKLAVIINVDLNEPTDEFLSDTQGAIQFNATSFIDNSSWFFENASLYSNRTGTFQLNALNDSEIINNTKFGLTDGTYLSQDYLWNVEVCVGDGIESMCRFSSNNFTFSIAQAGLEMRVFDEKTLDQLTFNVTISNTTDSVEFNNQTLLDVEIENLTIGESDIVPVNFTGGYAPRTYTLTLSSLIKHNLTAYLLKDTDATTVTFTVKNTIEEPIVGASIDIYKSISGSDTLVAELSTDGTGKASVGLDTTATYTVIVSKDGFDSVTFTYNPSSPFSETIILGSGSEVSPDTVYQNFFYSLIPRSSYLLLVNGTSEVNLTTAGSDLEYWNLSLEYNNSIIFSENSTSATGGSINGAFNLTDILGLSETFNLTQHTEEDGFPRIVKATFTFKREDQNEEIVEREYRLTENLRGLYNILTNIVAGETAKGLVWLLLTLIIVGSVSLKVGAFGIGSGLLALLMLGAGYVIEWISLLPFVIATFAVIGYILWTRS